MTLEEFLAGKTKLGAIPCTILPYRGNTLLVGSFNHPSGIQPLSTIEVTCTTYLVGHDEEPALVKLHFMGKTEYIKTALTNEFFGDNGQEVNPRKLIVRLLGADEPFDDEFFNNPTNFYDRRSFY